MDTWWWIGAKDCKHFLYIYLYFGKYWIASSRRYILAGGFRALLFPLSLSVCLYVSMIVCQIFTIPIFGPLQLCLFSLFLCILVWWTKPHPQSRQYCSQSLVSPLCVCVCVCVFMFLSQIYSLHFCYIFTTFLFNCCRCWQIFDKWSHHYYGYLWIFIGIYGYVKVCIGIYVYRWVCMDIYG